MTYASPVGLQCVMLTLCFVSLLYVIAKISFIEIHIWSASAKFALVDLRPVYFRPWVFPTSRLHRNVNFRRNSDTIHSYRSVRKKTAHRG